MWHFLKYMIQLLLSPARGWEDVSASIPNPDELQRRGFCPWVGVAAVSELLPWLYNHTEGFLAALESVIAIGAALFASLYVGRLFLGMALPKFIRQEVNPAKLNVFITYLMGINCLFLIFVNAMPASMTFLRLLPLLSVIIIFKSTAYLGIDEENQLSFTGLASVAVIVLPMVLGALLLFLI